MVDTKDGVTILGYSCPICDKSVELYYHQFTPEEGDYWVCEKCYKEEFNGDIAELNKIKNDCQNDCL
jgi:phosphoribosyl-AMP cyclohydrolase